jgi:hypothetical protein
MGVRWSRGWWCLWLWLAAVVAHAQSFEADVSGRVVKFPTRPDLLRVGQVDAETFGRMNFSTPPRKRLIEILMTERDLARAQAGELSEEPLFFFYEELRWQGREPPPEEWRALRESMQRVAAEVDPSTLGQSMETELNKASARKLDGRLQFEIPRIGKPVVYRSDDDSLRMYVRMSTGVRSGDREASTEMLLFAANLPMNGRMMLFNGACLCAADAERAAAFRAVFDAMVDRAIAENRPTTPVR